jgi:flagellar protein FliS
VNQSWKKYTESQVKTSNPVKLATMAYEKCILNVRNAKEMLINKEYEKASDRLKKTELILNELMMMLNVEADRELVTNLFMLYEWMVVEVRVMDGAKIPAKADGVIDVLQNLLDGYREVLNSVE